MKRLPQLLLAAAVVLAAVSGYFVAVSFGAGQQPTITTTVNVATGPTGPRGPTGPAGATECPTGFTFGVVVINHPGGQTSIATCIKENP